MSGRRRRNAGKGFSSFLYIVVFGLLTAVFTQVYPRVQRGKQYVLDLNQVRNDFSSQKWDAAITGYRELWEKYPDREREDVYNLAAAHENLAAELYLGSIQTRSNWGAAVEHFEKSAELRPLGEQSLISLGDCYIEHKKFGRAAELLAEVNKRSDVDKAKFATLRKRLEKATGAQKE